MLIVKPVLSLVFKLLLLMLIKVCSSSNLQGNLQMLIKLVLLIELLILLSVLISVIAQKNGVLYLRLRDSWFILLKRRVCKRRLTIREYLSRVETQLLINSRRTGLILRSFLNKRTIILINIFVNRSMEIMVILTMVIVSHVWWSDVTQYLLPLLRLYSYTLRLFLFSQPWLHVLSHNSCLLFSLSFVDRLVYLHIQLRVIVVFQITISFVTLILHLECYVLGQSLLKSIGTWISFVSFLYI